MRIPGTILCEADDSAAIMAAARELRARGESVTVTPGIRRVYAVRAEWERSYLLWRKAFSAWLLERTGERS